MKGVVIALIVLGALLPVPIAMHFATSGGINAHTVADSGNALTTTVEGYVEKVDPTTHIIVVNDTEIYVGGLWRTPDGVVPCEEILAMIRNGSYVKVVAEQCCCHEYYVAVEIQVGDVSYTRVCGLSNAMHEASHYRWYRHHMHGSPLHAYGMVVAKPCWNHSYITIEGVVEKVDKDFGIVVVNGTVVKVGGLWMTSNGSVITWSDVLSKISVGSEVSINATYSCRWGYIALSIEIGNESYVHVHS